MKRAYIYIIGLLINSIFAFSQGFDWQMPTRMPTKTSNIFIGGNIAAGKIIEFADFGYYEDKCNCGTFSDGNGFGYHAGIVVEYWLPDGLQSVSTQINYLTIQSKFQANHSLPVLHPDNSESRIHYRNTLEQTRSNIAIGLNYKKRLIQSNFSAGLGVNILLQLTNQQKHFEDILGPDWAAPFPTSPPSYRRFVEDGSIDDIYKIQMEPLIFVSYDFPLNIGLYATPYIQFGLPIFNNAKDGTRRTTSIKIGLSVLNWL